MLKVSHCLIIKLKLTARLNLSIIMHKTSVSTKRLIKWSAIDVNRQRQKIRSLESNITGRIRKNVKNVRSNNPFLFIQTWKYIVDPKGYWLLKIYHFVFDHNSINLTFFFYLKGLEIWGCEKLWKSLDELLANKEKLILHLAKYHLLIHMCKTEV